MSPVYYRSILRRCNAGKNLLFGWLRWKWKKSYSQERYMRLFRGKFGKFVSAEHGVKAELPLKLKSKNRMAKGVELIVGQDCLEFTFTLNIIHQYV